MPNGHRHTLREMLAIAAGLIALSALLYTLAWLWLGDAAGIGKYVMLHLSFLPIHALVLGLIIEELLAWHERRSRQRKLNLFLGIFFRQMGVDLYVRMVELVANREELERLILMEPGWKRSHFRRARRAVARLTLHPLPETDKLEAVFTEILARERDILKMTRNPSLWDFEELYRAVVALFHLIEEAHLRGDLERLSPAVLEHLAADAVDALRRLTILWLHYLEFLQQEHPTLFSFQAGVHNTVRPVMLEQEWDQE